MPSPRRWYLPDSAPGCWSECPFFSRPCISTGMRPGSAPNFPTGRKNGKERTEQYSGVVPIYQHSNPFWVKDSRGNTIPPREVPTGSSAEDMPPEVEWCPNTLSIRRGPVIKAGSYTARATSWRTCQWYMAGLLGQRRWTTKGNIGWKPEQGGNIAWENWY